MIDLTDVQLKKWKDTFAKDGIVYEKDEDYREAVANLVGYFDVLIEMDIAQKRASSTNASNDSMPTDK
jgi:threonine dehydrogenase-like Zn-dependent dehydrogenase